MKNHYIRLVTASAIVLAVMLTVLGIVLGQFFHLFADEVDPRIQQKYWVFLLFTLIFVYGAAMVVMAKMMQQYAQPIDYLTNIATQLAQGNYLVRAQVDHGETNRQLPIAINQIARNLQESSILRTMEQERLKTLISSIGSSLIVFEREGTVNLVNRVFEQTFKMDMTNLIGQSYKELALPEEIEQGIEAVFLTEESRKFQVRIQVEGETSYLDVYGAPVIGKHGNWLGIVVVMHDITKLIKLEEIRKDFVANVSHELRTPITSIKGFSETLLDGAVGDPAIANEFLEIIHKESTRLQLLIEDLLQLSSIEQEGFILNYQRIDLPNVIEESVQIVKAKMQSKEMELVLQMPSSLHVEADPDRLIQVMVNLLNNAITYSKEQTTITVTVKESGRFVKVEVKDEGIGIKQEELPRLFERFYRVDRARSRESGGTGLGLAIVKHIIEVHQGTIAVESEVGKGTVFTFTIPAKQP